MSINPNGSASMFKKFVSPALTSQHPMMALKIESHVPFASTFSASQWQIRSETRREASAPIKIAAKAIVVLVVAPAATSAVIVQALPTELLLETNSHHAAVA